MYIQTSIHPSMHTYIHTYLRSRIRDMHAAVPARALCESGEMVGWDERDDPQPVRPSHVVFAVHFCRAQTRRELSLHH